MRTVQTSMRSGTVALLATVVGAIGAHAADDAAPVARITIETVAERDVAYALGTPRGIEIDQFVSAAIDPNEPDLQPGFSTPATVETVSTEHAGLTGNAYEAGAPEVELDRWAPVPTVRPSNSSLRTAAVLPQPVATAERREARSETPRKRLVTLPVPLTLGAFR